MSGVTFGTFWHGSEITAYERLCFTSFLSHHHQIELYTYETDIELDLDVIVKDAAEILAPEEFFLYRDGGGRGSPSGFSNRFRYELLKKRGGWWTDTDVILLGPEVPTSDTFFAYQSSEHVNGAFMRFPAHHATMVTCAQRAEAAGSDVRWGQTGPKLLTAVLHEMDMLQYAAAQQSCYPIPWEDVTVFYYPRRFKEVIEQTSGSYAVHLWNEIIRQKGISKHVPPPKGSFLSFLFEKYEVNFQNVRYSEADIERIDQTWSYLVQKNKEWKGKYLRLVEKKNELAKRNQILKERLQLLSQELKFIRASDRR